MQAVSVFLHFHLVVFMIRIHMHIYTMYICIWLYAMLSSEHLPRFQGYRILHSITSVILQAVLVYSSCYVT